MNTLIGYTYRDGSNHKWSQAYVLRGDISQEQIVQYLHERRHFIPGDVGLISLHPTDHPFDPDDDHPWHELDVVEPTELPPTLDMSAEEFLSNIQAAAANNWPGQHTPFAW